MSTGEDDRPFVCTADGCGMRFTNEDHLTVHQQKHEMSLALGVDTSRGLVGFVADQTPTPTKFLKNCEEIGLFQDLNKNPFDDAFKRATDAINSAHEVGMPGPSSLDTPVLPSPFAIRLLKGPTHEKSPLAGATHHEKSPLAGVIHEKSPLAGSRKLKIVDTESPLIIDDGSKIRLDRSRRKDSGEPPAKKRPTPTLKIPTIRVSSPEVTSSESVAMETTVVPDGVLNTIDVVEEEIMAETEQPQSQDPNHLYILVDGQLIPLSSLSHMMSPTHVTSHVGASSGSDTSGSGSGAVNGRQVATTEAPPTGTTAAKQRLKAVLTGSTVPEPPRPDPPQSQLGVLGSVQSQLHIDTRSSKRTQGQLSPDGEAEKKRQHFLERNRAAAARCRNKRKAQIDGLEAKCSEMATVNSRLVNEIVSLKDEVANLKVMLLAHKDCEVTRRQQAEGRVGLGEAATNNSGVNLISKPSAADSSTFAVAVPSKNHPTKPLISPLISLAPANATNLNLLTTTAASQPTLNNQTAALNNRTSFTITIPASQASMPVPELLAKIRSSLPGQFQKQSQQQVLIQPLQQALHSTTVQEQRTSHQQPLQPTLQQVLKLPSLSPAIPKAQESKVNPLAPKVAIPSKQIASKYVLPVTSGRHENMQVLVCQNQSLVSGTTTTTTLEEEVEICKSENDDNSSTTNKVVETVSGSPPIPTVVTSQES